jgi:hypothetical protein
MAVVLYMTAHAGIISRKIPSNDQITLHKRVVIITQFPIFYGVIIAVISL